MDRHLKRTVRGGTANQDKPGLAGLPACNRSVSARALTRAVDLVSRTGISCFCFCMNHAQTQSTASPVLLYPGQG